MTRHFLEVDDLSPAELATVLDQAATGKADPSTIAPVLAGHGVALVFEKPSARTRVSSEMAVVALGGHPISIRADEVGIDTRETAEDVARTLASYCSLIAARVFDHGVLERIADVGRRAGREPAVRPGPPVPGARRPADAAGALRRSKAVASRTSG